MLLPIANSFLSLREFCVVLKNLSNIGVSRQFELAIGEHRRSLEKMRFHEKPPPASADDIQVWESFFSNPMPERLRDLLCESDGPVLYRDDTQKELQIFGAREATELYEEYCFDQYLPDCIPLCLDGSGVFAVLRLQDKLISDVWAVESGVLDWDDSVRLCSDVQELISREQPIENAIREQVGAGNPLHVQ